MALKDYFDEKHEFAAWLVILVGIIALFTGAVSEWPSVVLIAIGLFTLLGKQVFGGVKIGPQGLEVDDD